MHLILSCDTSTPPKTRLTLIHVGFSINYLKGTDMNLKRTLIAVTAGFVLAAPVCSQPYGMGPGMMGG